MSAINSIGLHSAYSSQPLATAIHAVDQWLLSRQTNSESWQRLLSHVFGQASPIELSGISLELLACDSMEGPQVSYAPIAPDGKEQIYLNAGWLASATAAEVEAVLLEELGHAMTHASMVVTTHQAMKERSFRH